ncbi:MAG: hypothetical protein QMD66_01250 [Actinomycetota bacterium]|nr:hypothetical protein [Actinomycetota bacterium]
MKKIDVENLENVICQIEGIKAARIVAGEVVPSKRYTCSSPKTPKYQIFSAVCLLFQEISQGVNGKGTLYGGSSLP